MKDKVVRTKKEIVEAISRVEKIIEQTSDVSAFAGSPNDVNRLIILMLKHKIIKEPLMRDLHDIICDGYCMDWYSVEKTQWFLIGLIEIDEAYPLNEL